MLRTNSRGGSRRLLGLETSLGRTHRGLRRAPNARHVLLLEQLEDRTVPSTITLLNNNGYAGLDFNQSGGYVPPDTNGAAGPSSYVETVNQTLAIYSPKATGDRASLGLVQDFWYTQAGLAPTK